MSDFETMPIGTRNVMTEVAAWHSAKAEECRVALSGALPCHAVAGVQNLCREHQGLADRLEELLK